MTKDQALQLLESVCSILQKRDRDKGYSNVMYEHSFNRIKRGIFFHSDKPDLPIRHDGTRGYLSLIDILDDAINCNLLSAQQYNDILQTLKP